jgi:hypothetical protein
MASSTTALFAFATDLLTPITLFTMWLGVTANETKCATRILAALFFIGVGALAAAMAWYPPLAAIRIEPAPGGQVAMVAALAFVVPILLLAVPTSRVFLAKVDPRAVARLGLWRAVYGSLLLAMGLTGGLPEGFFTSVAMGDIAIGLWAFAIATWAARVSDRHLLAWNIAGLLDLLHVIPLAVMVLRPFLLANPDAPTLNLLPMAGVPLFIALHIITIKNLLTKSRAIAL